MSKHRCVDCAVVSRQFLAALALFLHSERRNEGSFLVVPSCFLVHDLMVPFVTMVTILPSSSLNPEQTCIFVLFERFLEISTQIRPLHEPA